MLFSGQKGVLHNTSYFLECTAWQIDKNRFVFSTTTMDHGCSGIAVQSCNLTSTYLWSWLAVVILDWYFVFIVSVYERSTQRGYKTHSLYRIQNCFLFLFPTSEGSKYLWGSKPFGSKHLWASDFLQCFKKHLSPLLYQN